MIAGCVAPHFHRDIRFATVDADDSRRLAGVNVVASFDPNPALWMQANPPYSVGGNTDASGHVTLHLVTWPIAGILITTHSEGYRDARLTETSVGELQSNRSHVDRDGRASVVIPLHRVGTTGASESERGIMLTPK
jgi:hypothetical protein